MLLEIANKPCMSAVVTTDRFITLMLSQFLQVAGVEEFLLVDLLDHLATQLSPLFRSSPSQSSSTTVDFTLPLCIDALLRHVLEWGCTMSDGGKKHEVIVC